MTSIRPDSQLSGLNLDELTCDSKQHAEGTWKKECVVARTSPDISCGGSGHLKEEPCPEPHCRERGVPRSDLQYTPGLTCLGHHPMIS